MSVNTETRLKHIVNMVCGTCSIKFSDFYLIEGAKYVRLSDSSHFSKCENGVITLRGVRNFEWKLNLLSGAKSYLCMPKIRFRNRPVFQSTRNINIQTNIRIHT